MNSFILPQPCNCTLVLCLSTIKKKKKSALLQSKTNPCIYFPLSYIINLSPQWITFINHSSPPCLKTLPNPMSPLTTTKILCTPHHCETSVKTVHTIVYIHIHKHIYVCLRVCLPLCSIFSSDSIWTCACILATSTTCDSPFF